MVPGLLGLLGGTSAGLAMAPALRALTFPFLGLTVAVLARGWYLELALPGRWRSPSRTRARLVLIGSTGLAAVLWVLRFAGLLGMRPL